MPASSILTAQCRHADALASFHRRHVEVSRFYFTSPDNDLAADVALPLRALYLFADTTLQHWRRRHSFHRYWPPSPAFNLIAATGFARRTQLLLGSYYSGFTEREHFISLRWQCPYRATPMMPLY